jgi:hypothetical protein
VPRFSPRTIRRQRRRVQGTMPRRRASRRTKLRRRMRHRTTFLAPTGRCRITSRNRSLCPRLSRIVSRQSSRIIGRNQGLRRSPSRIIIRSRTARLQRGQTIGRSRRIRRQPVRNQTMRRRPVRITSRCQIAMSRLSGRRLLRRASGHSPSSARLRRLRMPRPHNHSPSNPWRGRRNLSRRRSLRKSQKGMRSRRNDEWT